MRFMALALSAVILLAQDSRNTSVPNTDTHFTMPEYRTLAEWEARKAHLRKQILSAAGLLPMPVKSPLNPRISGRVERANYSVEKVLLETMPGFYLGGQPLPSAGPAGKASGHRDTARALDLRPPGESAAGLHSRTLHQPRAAGVRRVRVRHARVQRHRPDAAHLRRARRAVVVVRTAGAAVVELDSRGGLPAVARRCGPGAHRGHRRLGRRHADVSAGGGGRPREVVARRSTWSPRSCRAGAAARTRPTFGWAPSTWNSRR